ncbi:ATPase WRNIP1-like [Culicoides brevitarsis]|uniref:ATPase WRNIP1-like n=1 Tax=Culicoides brevitarsis TaxID=469753 RepID=UPI00307CA207
MENDDAEQEVSCPICDKFMSSKEIVDHVDRCIFLRQEEEAPNRSSDNITNVRDGKRAFPLFEKSFNPAPKKQKLSPGRNIAKNNKKIPQKTIDLTSNENEEPSEMTSSKSLSDQKVEKDEESMSNIPLAERVRPKTIEELIGQSNILGKGTVLRKLFENAEIPSMILWGPPGCGKTSFSNVIHQKCKDSNTLRFVKTSAAFGSGVNDIKEIIKVAKNEAKFKRKTILFMDEIHRFNKAQQDIFLPHVENGTITLIGATTENPSFSLNNALLSRCRVIVLEKLQTDELIEILKRGLEVYKGICVDKDAPLADVETLGYVPEMIVERGTLKWLAEMSDGDARNALNSLQLAIQAVKLKDKKQNGILKLNIDELKDGIKRSHILYDRKGDQHYDMISALHKSIRASDDNAALYWATRMMIGGEDPRYICRRLVRAASEDIGLADPNAIAVALNALQAVQLVGMPEADCIIAQCAVYLARAPKSTETYHAMKRCQDMIKNHQGAQPAVPLHLRNAPTKLMKDLGYAAGYNTLHKDESGFDYMPEGLEDVNFF